MSGTHDSHDHSGGEGEVALTAAVIAQVVGGTLVGDGEAAVTSVAALDRAQPDQLSFCASAKYSAQLEATKAGVVLVDPSLAGASAPGARALVQVAKPQEAMLTLLARLYPARPRSPGVHATASIGKGARLGTEVEIAAGVIIGPGAVIGDRVRLDAHVVIGDGVSVGDDSILFPHVTLYPGTSVGRRVRLHSGVRLGGDGYGYVFRDGQHQKIEHVGRCIVEDDVEIGANSTVDRGSVDDTVIGAGTKIDNLVHVGHNVRIGKLCLLMAQVGIAGSTHIGDGVILAGQAGIGGHISIGSGARIGGQAGVFGSVPAGETWSGYPARPHRDALRAQAAVFKLPAIIRALERLVSGDKGSA